MKTEDLDAVRAAVAAEVKARRALSCTPAEKLEDAVVRRLAAEPEPAKDEAELVERMYEAWANDLSNARSSMAAALRVAHEAGAVPSALPDKPIVLMPDGERIPLDDPRVLGTPTLAEWEKSQKGSSVEYYTHRTDFEHLLASRLAALQQKPKTPAERVTVGVTHGNVSIYYIDGKIATDDQIRKALVAAVRNADKESR